jgi:hypothetical protein
LIRTTNLTQTADPTVIDARKKTYIKKDSLGNEIVPNDKEEQEKLAAYRTSYEELVRQWDEAFTKKEAELRDKYQRFVDALRDAWDLDEMKMLVEHYFGEYVE